MAGTSPAMTERDMGLELFTMFRSNAKLAEMGAGIL
jgi:hypothetical protein